MLLLVSLLVSSLVRLSFFYIKSRKKDSMGISPLQNLSEEYIIDNKGKAEILNKQYDSVTSALLMWLPLVFSDSLSLMKVLSPSMSAFS
jgi:hypothetical protein